MQFLDSKTTAKILSSAKKQQQEMESEFGLRDPSDRDKPKHRLTSNNSDDDDEDEFPALSDTIPTTFEEDGSRLMSDLQISAEDEAALSLFMVKEPVKKLTLGDYIAEMIKKKEQMLASNMSDMGSIDGRHVKLDHRVVSLYKGVKEVMSKYRSGKVPKAFKVIPSLQNWEQVLDITCPDSYSSAAMYAAVRMFANTNDKMAQRFYNLILLPRIRDDIEEYKRLNYHLYQCLRKALFRPAAFFKGIILPLVQDGDCTLREAVILSSVMAKNSIPMLHSAAAILKIADMEYSGASSVFMHTLISKRYALPYRVIDGVVDHFIRFMGDKRTMPVLWHQTLMSFVNIYAADIASEQRDALFELLKVHPHHQMTDVIRKKLANTRPRDEEEVMLEPDVNEDMQ
jgi:essential nuclear protein 1